MIENNDRNLTHLDLSEMVALNFEEQLRSIGAVITPDQALIRQLDISRLLTSVTTHSKSLQVIHLNRNHLSRAQKLGIAMCLGIQRYPADQTLYQEISEQYRDHKEV